ncbi:uncharacterized protein N7498_009922 [Penicillium cinerascens]|uniref:Uncharacterized protein n=1 Tax=Penicillium cinerascens TaxID=70096 RepID=A0A9W9J6S3_9EURO|nr:uncharacterized protein N7498_009922 [Penicillium cinerascens]KAJ5190937.1 hypothetical protein N7498_009922 [Penicillium cinerascens]
MRSLGLSDRPVSEWSAKAKAQVMESFHGSFNALEHYVAQGEADGKLVFAKEHCNFLEVPSSPLDTKAFTVQLPDRYAKPGDVVSVGNPTVLPDEFLRSWIPIFLIRHPARLFPSLCRALLEFHRMSLRGTRRLYDWYANDIRSRGSPSDPILLDSDDVINETGVIEQLPAQESKLAQASSSDDLFLDTLMTSSGIQSDKVAGNINIDEEAIKWRADFGDAVGALVERCVKEAMLDYNHLKSTRLLGV